MIPTYSTHTVSGESMITNYLTILALTCIGNPFMRLFFNDSTTFLANYFMNSIIYKLEIACFTSFSFLCINITTEFA